MHSRPRREGLTYSFMSTSLDRPGLGDAGNAVGTPPVLTPGGLSSQCAKDSAHWGWDSINTFNKYIAPTPTQGKNSMKGHWEAARDHNDPSAAPPAGEVRERHEDKSQNAKASESPQPSPGPQASGSTLWKDMAESPALSSRQPQAEEAGTSTHQARSALFWREGNFLISSSGGTCWAFPVQPSALG